MSDTITSPLKTPLYEEHLALKAHILPFHNWLMPIYYSGILKEHEATRQAVGLFDVSHMGEFIIKGKKAYDFLHYLTPARLEKLNKGQVCYSMLLDEQGGILDDITIYCLSDQRDEYQLCVNAGNIAKDWAHIHKHASKFAGLELKNISDEVALLAIQGPESPKLLVEILDDSVLDLGYYHCRRYQFLNENCLLARMGYTGEDGYEWFMPAKIAKQVWQKLLNCKQKALPAGLGARDILRLEMGYPLHGQDISPEYNPVEAGLSWCLRKDLDFIGAQALVAKKANLQRKLVALKTTEKATIRAGDKVFANLENAQNEQNALTELNSGSISPILNSAIGLGYLPLESSQIGTQLYIRSGRRILQAEICKLPFITQPQKPYLN